MNLSKMNSLALLRLCVPVIYLAAALSVGVCSAQESTAKTKNPASEKQETKTEKAEDKGGDSDSKKVDAEVQKPAPKKQPKRVDRTGILNELTFDDLKFEMEKGGDFKRSMLTEEINDYHGTTVRIRGFIRPNNKQSGLTKFVFVRDNQECCFGPTAAIFDNILVKLANGKETDYTVRPVVVEGKFALKEYMAQDGKIWSLYRMYQAQVK